MNPSPSAYAALAPAQCETSAPERRLHSLPAEEPAGATPVNAPSPQTARFIKVVIPLTDHLLRQAWNLCAQRVDAEDLVQETILKAFVSYGSYREGSNLEAWLHRIMVNTWLDAYRTAQRRPAEQLSGGMADDLLTARDSTSSRARQSAELEMLSALPGAALLALRNLPEDVRRAIYYADVEGYRNTEIAEILNIPVGTVGSRLSRGRRTLREVLTQNCPSARDRGRTHR